MAVNQYGIDSKLWASMSPEDQNQVIADWNAAHQVAYTPPTIGGYVAPTPQQVTTALAGSGLPSTTQTAVQSAYNTQFSPVSSATGATQPAATGTTATGTPANPGWIYAVNMPSTYPDYAAMKAAGAGLVVADDDPNYVILVAGARQWGVPIAVNVAAHNGETPEAYAARVRAAQGIAPDKLVLDVESVGKGYEGSAGWNWSTQAAALLKPIVGSTQVAVSMEPNQADYNYGAYQGLSSGGNTQYWVQAYTGDMTAYDPAAATAPARAAVGDANVVTIFAPNVPPPTGYAGTYVSYGIPTTGVSSAGIYAPGATSNTPYYPGQQPVAGAGSGATPGPPIFVNPGGQFGGGANTPPPGSTTGSSSSTAGSATSTNGGWAEAYFSSFGLPPDVAAKVNQIFTQYPDTDQAIQFALGYIRGTPWYAQTFPGIQYGMQHGIISNENDYRQYVTALETLSQRYNGRHISGLEVTRNLAAGLTPDIVGKKYEGIANLQTNGADWNYYLGGFSDQGRLTNVDDQRALGEEQAGLDSPLGQKLNKALQQSIQKYQTLFQGQAATPSLSLGKTGLSAPSLAGGKTTPDVGA